MQCILNCDQCETPKYNNNILLKLVAENFVEQNDEKIDKVFDTF